jgi:sulfur carrier protein
MNISINGEERDIEGQKSLSDLVEELGLEPRMILIEHNGCALHRSEWLERGLAEGDRIEILQVAAGG